MGLGGYPLRESSNMKGHWILLADDDPDFALLCRIALENVSPEHQLDSVADGGQAINRLREGSIPQLIIVDQHLPRASGLEVVRWIRQRPSFDLIPIVVITGLAREGDSEKALHAGAAEFLVKPLEFNCLLELFKGLSLRWLFQENAPTRQAA